MLSGLGLGCLLLGLVSIASLAGASPATAPSPTATTSTTVSGQATVPILPTTVAEPVPEDARCPQWWGVARDAGWAEEHLRSLDTAMWRESRCLPDQHNASDPNGGSYGLLQINGFWCLPSRYWPDGYLQAHGILGGCDDLYDPVTALSAGLAIYRYAEDNADCGWAPWATMTCP